YLIERAHKASIDTDALHISALLPFIGKRTLRQIHDATLAPVKAQRRRDGVSETTIKRALEVVRCILNLAARSWRDEHGLTWLETAPLITMPDTRMTARKPYPLSWDEQRRLFALLPGSVAQMALFAVNTGCRVGLIRPHESEVRFFFVSVSLGKPGRGFCGEVMLNLHLAK